MNQIDRRQFVRNLGVSTATLPFLVGLPSLGLAKTAPRRQRLVVMFSPNGTIPKNFWPETTGSDFEFLVGCQCKHIFVRRYVKIFLAFASDLNMIHCDALTYKFIEHHADITQVMLRKTEIPLWS